MIRRLRDYPTDAELAQLYATPHQHTRWEDHKLRVALTVDVGRWLGPFRTIADLSCGDAAISFGIDSGQTSHARTYLGDYAPGYEFTGRIEDTLHMIPAVDLYICSETIEHLENPDTVLRMIRMKAQMLVLSTPIDETPEVGNPEHIWGWDVGDVRKMLHDAGWTDTTLVRCELPRYTYDYQIWGCT